MEHQDLIFRNLSLNIISIVEHLVLQQDDMKRQMDSLGLQVMNITVKFNELANEIRDRNANCNAMLSLQIFIQLHHYPPLSCSC